MALISWTLYYFAACFVINVVMNLVLMAADLMKIKIVNRKV